MLFTSCAKSILRKQSLSLFPIPITITRKRDDDCFLFFSVFQRNMPSHRRSNGDEGKRRVEPRHIIFIFGPTALHSFSPPPLRRWMDAGISGAGSPECRKYVHSQNGETRGESRRAWCPTQFPFSNRATNAKNRIRRPIENCSLKPVLVILNLIQNLKTYTSYKKPPFEKIIYSVGVVYTPHSPPARCIWNFN